MLDELRRDTGGESGFGLFVANEEQRKEIKSWQGGISGHRFKAPQKHRVCNRSTIVGAVCGFKRCRKHTTSLHSSKQFGI